MAKILYIVETGGDNEALRDLSAALLQEFPAFYISDTARGDMVAAVVVQNIDEVPDKAWDRLDGWGHGNLTLELVR